MSTYLQSGDPEAVQAYGFQGQSVTDPEAWVRSATANGQVVGRWTDHLRVHCDPARETACLASWRESGQPLAPEMDFRHLGSFWEVMEYFSLGELDALLIGTQVVTYPAKGRELLRQMSQSLTDNDGTTDTPDQPKAATPELADYSNAVAGDPFLLNQWGKLLSYVGRHTDAAAAFRQAIELQPGFSEPYSNFATLLWNFGKRREAFTLLAEALMRNPHRTATQLNFFDAGHELEEYAAMAQIIEQLLPQIPDLIEFRHHLAICYHHLGRTAEATQVLQGVLAQRPDDAEAQELLKGFHEPPVQQ